MGRWIDRRKRHKKKDGEFNPLSIWFVLYVFVIFADLFARFMTGYVLVAKDPLDADQYHVLQAYNYERALSYLAYLDPVKEALRSVNAGEFQFLSDVPDPRPDNEIYTFIVGGPYPGLSCSREMAGIWPETQVIQPIKDDLNRAACEWTYCENRDKSLPATLGGAELLVDYHMWAAEFNKAIFDTVIAHENLECTINEGAVISTTHSKADRTVRRYRFLHNPFEF